ncbi:hypothetical protein BBP40_003759 [Aspergillus hancockii]|nr:hypothetical protein BBP40_003759 [Aspergillus hancockii]
MLSPVYQGLPCQPATVLNATCSLGGHPAYAVNVSSVAHIQLAINFARQTGVRLVVKTPGHDFSSKSGGAGALSIWTHHLKGIQHIPSYNVPGANWTGAAFKHNAGTQPYEIYKAAQGHQLTIVGGEGQTVGIAGGYILGGGHSLLSSIHRPSRRASPLNESRASGRTLRNSPPHREHRALLGAARRRRQHLRGHPPRHDKSTRPPSQPQHQLSPGQPAGKATSRTTASGPASAPTWTPSSSTQTQASTRISSSSPPTANSPSKNNPSSRPTRPSQKHKHLLNPWFTRFQQLGIPFMPKTQFFDNFYSAWNSSFPLEVVEKAHVATVSGLFPKSAFQNQTALATFDALRTSSEAGLTLIAFNMAPPPEREVNLKKSNAVNIVWRRTVMHAPSSVNWSPDLSAQEIAAARHDFTHGHMQRWSDVIPGSGAYLDESDRMEPGF